MPSTYDWKNWPEDAELLWFIYLLDPEQEGIIETHLTCNDDGVRNPETMMILQRLEETGFIIFGSHHIDITDAGVEECQRERFRHAES